MCCVDVHAVSWARVHVVPVDPTRPTFAPYCSGKQLLEVLHPMVSASDLPAATAAADNGFNGGMTGKGVWAAPPRVFVCCC